ncbi:tRNA guanosine(34) transglycosylase Tgt, partial [Alphaproteobacteria bacterium]|nr:tRNA guanosine(34) transglycosylase Tgt [Alphaproteobacteria bacterium]
PGSETIANHGGLHKFMNWHGPMLTDSGGFQIFSLGHGSVADEIKGRNKEGIRKKSLLNIFEEGALFKSHIDGSRHLLTPEKSIAIQRDIGADLILVFDECTPFHVEKSYTAKSMRRSHRWSTRSLNSFELSNKFKSTEGSAGPQSLYGIIQGGIFKDLRDESIDFNLHSNNFFGLAIGGSLGSSKKEMHQIVQYTASKLKDKHPIHLLGIGDPSDIWSLVRWGVDTFDCVSPTRLARHGAALIKTRFGKINIKNSKYREDLNPIDDQCQCQTCTKYSLSYLHHLLKSDELLGLMLITSHNMYFMNDLMLYIRKAIKEDKLLEAEKNWYQD